MLVCWCLPQLGTNKLFIMSDRVSLVADSFKKICTKLKARYYFIISNILATWRNKRSPFLSILYDNSYRAAYLLRHQVLKDCDSVCGDSMELLLSSDDVSPSQADASCKCQGMTRYFAPLQVWSHVILSLHEYCSNF